MRNTGDTGGERIILAHGGGGELTKRLIEKHILPRLGNNILDRLEDSAIINDISGTICMTTDAFVVQPLEFPGGDIGRLAVCGTVNDLAVMGAVPVALSLALIIEEGLEIAFLDKIIDSIAKASQESGVGVVTGDTKVIEKFRGDGLTITTTGIGAIPSNISMDMAKIEPGDAIIVTGRIAEHGLAVMSVREGLSFKSPLVSDVAPLNGMISGILQTGAGIKFMRDPTRCGIAGVLSDIAEETGFSVEIEEEKIPVSNTARHAAEMLGLDVLTVANEGKCVIVVSPEDVDKVLDSCRKHAYGIHVSRIGEVMSKKPALVEMLTRIGGRRIVQRPYGEELPRIC